MSGAQIPDDSVLSPQVRPHRRAPGEGEARRHRHASGPDEPRHRDRLRRGRRSAVGDPRQVATASPCAWRCSPRSRATCRRAATTCPRSSARACKSPCVHPTPIAAPSSSKTAESSRRRASPASSSCSRCGAEVRARAPPGSFVHLTCDRDVPMRRPLSIMRANARRAGSRCSTRSSAPDSRALAARRAGDASACWARSARASSRIRERPRALLVGGGVGIPPMVFLAESMRERTRRAVEAAGADGLGDSVSVPGAALDDPRAGMPAGAIACMPLLDDWGVPSRLASKAGFPGCYDGFVTELAAEWLGSLDAARWPRSRCSPAAPRRC